MPAKTPELKTGFYTIQEVLDAVGFDFAEAEGDFRRVRISGRVGFDALDDVINLNPGGEPVTVELDGKEVAKLNVVE